MPVVKLRIGPADHGRAMTLEEFRRAEEQPGYLYELARGVLEVGEVPDDDHGQVVDNVHEAISRYRRRHRGRIRRIAHGSDVRPVIPELKSDRHPDLGIIFRTGPINARGRQEWVCEVVSPGARARRRDYQQRSEEYLALGVREYWIVDPARSQGHRAGPRGRARGTGLVRPGVPRRRAHRQRPAAGVPGDGLGALARRRARGRRRPVRAADWVPGESPRWRDRNRMHPERTASASPHFSPKEIGVVRDVR